MIIDRLELRNFKRFKNQEIQFKDGITGILGNNGTGKSSIVEAIFFALYGVEKTGSLQSDYIFSSFASPKEQCEVRLDFRIGGNDYTVVRTFKNGKTIANKTTFHKAGKLIATGVREVETEVRRTIGMGRVDFRNTIYAAQKDLLTLLESDPGKRREWFLKALGIDYLNKESQNILKERVDVKSAELTSLDGEIKAMTRQQGEVDLEVHQQSIASSIAAITQHTERKDRLKEQRADLDRQQKALADQRTVYSGLLKQQQALRGELREETVQKTKVETALALIADEEAEYHRIEKTARSYAEVLARLDGLRKVKADYDKITAELGFVQREISEFNTRIVKQQAAIAGLDRDAGEMTRQVGVVRAGLGLGPEISEDRLDGAVSYRLAEIMKLAGTLTAHQKQYQEERAKLQTDQETIRSAGKDGVCPLCRQKLGEHFGSLDAEFSGRMQEIAGKATADRQQQEKLEQEKNRIEALKPVLNTIRTLAGNLKLRAGYETDLSDLRARHDNKIKERQELVGTRDRLAYDDAAYQAAEKEAAAVQGVQARFTELGKKIGQAVTLKQQREELVARIAKRNHEIVKLDQEIKASAFDPDKARKIEAALFEADTAIRNEEVAIANATKDRAFAQEKIAEFRRTEEQIAGLKDRAGVLEEEIGLLKLTRGIIAEYVVYLMQVVRGRLEGEVSRIIGEITNSRYEQVLLDEDFNLLVRDIDADYAIDRFSGGEQDDIAVALRIALSRYLAELHQVHESTVLIFDEIFGSQDEERRNSLLTALRSQESRFPQILLISHIAEIQGEFSNTLIVEMAPDRSSRVKEAV